MTANNQAAVEQRLVAARDQLAAAEARYAAESINLALSDDEKAGANLRAEIAAARDRVALCVLAVRLSDQLETERKRAATDRATRAARRALGAQLGACERAATEITAAQVELVAAYRRLIESAGSARSLLPPQMRGTAAGFADLLSLAHLQRLCELSEYKLAEGGLSLAGSKMPALIGPFGNSDFRAVPPLADAIRTITDAVRRHLSPSNPPPATTDNGAAAGVGFGGSLSAPAAPIPEISPVSPPPGDDAHALVGVLASTDQGVAALPSSPDHPRNVTRLRSAQQAGEAPAEARSDTAGAEGEATEEPSQAIDDTPIEAAPAAPALSKRILNYV